jgi:hypothetical protein
MVAGSPLYESSEAIIRELEDLHVEYVLFDRSPGAMGVPYFRQINDMVAGTTRVERIDAFSPRTGAPPSRALELYRIKLKSPGDPKPLRLNLEHTLGRTLER